MPRPRWTGRRAPTPRDAAAARHAGLAACTCAGRARGGRAARRRPRAGRDRAHLDGGRPRPAQRVQRAGRPRGVLEGARGRAAGGTRSTSPCTRPRTSRRTRRPGLALAAVLPRADARDAWCGPHGSLAAVPPGARVGTASMRRGAQLRSLRPDLSVESLRGNVDTRLRKRIERGLDGVVLAACGLDRLDLAAEIGFRVEVEEMLPETGQGFLALQARSEDAAALSERRRPRARARAAGRAHLRCAARRRLPRPRRDARDRAARRASCGCAPGSPARRLPVVEAEASGTEPKRWQGMSRPRHSVAEARRSSRRCGRDGLPRRGGPGRPRPDHRARPGASASRRRDRLRPACGRCAARSRAGRAACSSMRASSRPRRADTGADDAGADRARPPRRRRRAPQGRRPAALRPRRRGGAGAARGRRRLRDRARGHLGDLRAGLRGVPVTHRGLAAQVTIVTGHEQPGKAQADVDWAALATLPGTLVVLMGVGAPRRRRPRPDRRRQGARDARVRHAVGHHGGAAQRRRTLATIAAAVEAADPLAGRHGDRRRGGAARASSPGPSGGRCTAGASSSRARAPRPAASWRGCATSAPRSTSAPSSASSRSPARRSTRRLRPRLRDLAERPAAAAGALRRRCARARGRDRRGHRARHRGGAARDRDRRRRRRRALVAEGLLEALPADLHGVRALVARAEEARDTLPDGLRAAGAEVDVVPLYRTLAALPRHPERMLAADAVAFTSSSTVGASPRRSPGAISRACAASRSAR